MAAQVRQPLKGARKRIKGSRSAFASIFSTSLMVVFVPTAQPLVLAIVCGIKRLGSFSF